jgi:hypothetical protein
LACKKAFTSLFCLRESVYLRDAGSDETGNKGARGGEARDSELEDHGAWAAWDVGPVACGSKLPACAPRFCLLFPVPCSLFLLRTLPQRGGEGFLGTGGLVAEGLCVFRDLSCNWWLILRPQAVWELSEHSSNSALREILMEAILENVERGSTIYSQAAILFPHFSDWNSFPRMPIIHGISVVAPGLNGDCEETRRKNLI